MQSNSGTGGLEVLGTLKLADSRTLSSLNYTFYLARGRKVLLRVHWDVKVLKSMMTMPNPEQYRIWPHPRGADSEEPTLIVWSCSAGALDRGGH